MRRFILHIQAWLTKPLGALGLVSVILLSSTSASAQWRPAGSPSSRTSPAPVRQSSPVSRVGYTTAEPTSDFHDDAPLAPPAIDSTSPEDLRIHQAVEEYLQQRESQQGSLPQAETDRIDSLQKAWDDFVANAQKKTYPNITVNGVFQADVGWFNQDLDSLNQYGRIQDGADFRRARLSAKGAVTEFTNYFFQMDFGFPGRPTFTDVWVEQTSIPGLGTVRIGQWKQPFSLEVVSSFRYTTFMERSLLFNAFTPFRHIGVGFYDVNDDQTMTWAASLFRSGQDQYGGSISTDGGWGTAERLTFLPLWECEGEEYLHLGLGHFFNAPPRDLAIFRTIPEFFIGQNAPGLVGTSGVPTPGVVDGTPFFISTGLLRLDNYNVLGTEFLWVEGPFSLQSETMVNFVDLDDGNRSTLWGSYAQAGWFLTGEHRPYDRKSGAIDRVKPFTNFGPCTRDAAPGIGAWELAARWSHLNLNDNPISGGTMTDFTLGLNWYWNPYTKMVFNYIHAAPDAAGFPKSQTNMFGLRAQIDF